MCSGGWSLERSLEQCLQCQDTLSLYRLALKMTLDSLGSDREQHIMRQVVYLGVWNMADMKPKKKSNNSKTSALMTFVYILCADTLPAVLQSQWSE